MLIDPGKLGLCLCVVLTYPEATPKGGFDGRMTRREYSLPHSPREIETAPGVDRDVTLQQEVFVEVAAIVSGGLEGLRCGMPSSPLPAFRADN